MAQYLSMEQLAYYAGQAGFQGEALRDIVAIAWAESGGRIDAVGDGGNSHGLTQVYAPAHPQFDATRLLSDPLYAFQAAYQISGGGKNFDPWTTWSHSTSSGAQANAQQYLDAAQTAVTGVQAAIGQGGQIVTTPSTKPSAAVTGTTSGSTLTAGSDTRAVSADQLPPNATPQQIEHYIQVHYPQAAPFLANPEIRSILLRPDIADMDETEVEALLRNTQYWQTHGSDSRAFDALIAQDGQKAGQVVENAKNVLDGVFQRNGVHLADDQLGNVAKQAIRSGWINLDGQVADPAKLQDFVAFSLRQTGKPLQGEGAATADSLSATARSYGITLSRPTLDDWALRMQEGNATEDSFKGYLGGLARGMWQNDPDVLRSIDEGRTPAQFFDPYKQQIANILEMSPDQVDLFGDPKWREVTQHFDPTMNGGKGGRRAMTIGEAEQFARHQPEFAGTAAYRQNDADIATKLGSFLGTAA